MTFSTPEGQDDASAGVPHATSNTTWPRRAIRASLFSTKTGKLVPQDASWAGICTTITNATITAKDQMPILILARYGNTKDSAGSLRHDGNVLATNGITAVHSSGTMAIADAMEKLDAAHVVAIVNGTPDYTPALPAWYVVFPFSREHPPDEHRELFDLANRILDGALGYGSYSISQGVPIGRVAQHADGSSVEYVVRQSKGQRLLDTCSNGQDVNETSELDGHNTNIDPPPAGNPIAPNLEMARDFLQRLDPEADQFTFQTFDDSALKRKPLARIHQIYPANGGLDALSKWQQHGAGVFCTVNTTDGKGREAHNVVRVRALFVDLDGAPLEPLLTGPLEPHIVCESSPERYHAYWLCHDCPLEQFKSVQKALALKFSGDRTVHDLPRVMRMPGFVHQKSQPFRTRMLDGVGFNGPPYKLAQIVGALELQLDAKPDLSNGAQHIGEDGKVHEGGRNVYLFALGRSMANKGMTHEAVYAALAAENQARCEPPLDDKDVRYNADRAFAAKDDPNWKREAAMDDEWPEPQSLAIEGERATYPVEALPDGIREAVAEVLEFVQCPSALAACSALAALSIAAQGLANVQRTSTLRGPISLYLLTIADSGERKSACDNYFIESIRDWEKESAAQHKQGVADAKAKIRAWEQRKAGIQLSIRDKAKKGHPCQAEEQRLKDEEANEPKPCRVPRVIHNDATPEALGWSLANEWPSGGVLSNEAGIVFGGHGMGRDVVMRNTSFLNTLWDGASHRVERRQVGGSYEVRGARLTMGMMTQADTVRQFMEATKGLPRGNGFAARFLIACPLSTQGSRTFRDEPQWLHLPRFEKRLRDLLDTPITLDMDGAIVPLTLLKFTTAAMECWKAFLNEVERELGPGGDMGDTRDVASKAADNVARLAALFHLYAHGPSGNDGGSNGAKDDDGGSNGAKDDDGGRNGGKEDESTFTIDVDEIKAAGAVGSGGGGSAAAPVGYIGVESVQSAATIVRWHLYQARAFLRDVAAPREYANAAKLNAWLLDYCRRKGVTEVERATILQRGPNAVRSKAALDVALAPLIDARRVREAKRDRLIVQVNPALLE